MLFQHAGKQFIPDVTKNVQRLFALCGIKENPIIGIANVEFRVTRIDQVLIHAGNAAVSIAGVGFIIAFAEGFSDPVGVKGQQYQLFPHPLIRNDLAAKDKFNALPIREGVLRIVMKPFQNRFD